MATRERASTGPDQILSEAVTADPEAREQAFRWVLRAYVSLLAVGLAAFVAALAEGLVEDGPPATTAVFAGISVTSLVSLLVLRPLPSPRARRAGRGRGDGTDRPLAAAGGALGSGEPAGEPEPAAGTCRWRAPIDLTGAGAEEALPVR